MHSKQSLNSKFNDHSYSYKDRCYISPCHGFISFQEGCISVAHSFLLCSSSYIFQRWRFFLVIWFLCVHSSSFGYRLSRNTNNESPSSVDEWRDDYPKGADKTEQDMPKRVAKMARWLIALGRLGDMMRVYQWAGRPFWMNVVHHNTKRHDTMDEATTSGFISLEQLGLRILLKHKIWDVYMLELRLISCKILAYSG